MGGRIYNTYVAGAFFVQCVCTWSSVRGGVMEQCEGWSDGAV